MKISLRSIGQKQLRCFFKHICDKIRTKNLVGYVNDILHSKIYIVKSFNDQPVQRPVHHSKQRPEKTPRPEMVPPWTHGVQRAGQWGQEDDHEAVAALAEEALVGPPAAVQPFGVQEKLQHKGRICVRPLMKVYKGPCI